jgi:hypothetical protein
VRETVERFAHTWQHAADVINGRLRQAIDRHLQSVPLWASARGRH